MLVTHFLRLFARCCAPLAILVAAWMLVASHARAEDVPLPAAPRTFVTDEPGVLSPHARSSLDARLQRFQQQTGHQFVVWIGTSLQGRTVEDFAVQAFEAWGVGRKAEDDGVALFVFVEERKARIEVGYGLEGTLTDLLSAQVIQNVLIPALKTNRWDEGVTGSVDAVLGILGGDPGAAHTQDPRLRPHAPAKPSLAKIIVAVVLGIGFLILLVTNPGLAMLLLFNMMGGGRGGGFGGGGGGFGGGGGRSGGGGASGGW